MRRRLLWLLLIPALYWLWTLPRWEGSDSLPLPQRLKTAAMLRTAQKEQALSVEEAEAAWIADGLPVLDSHWLYPDYLANSAELAAFCREQRDDAALLRCPREGEVRVLLFLRNDADVWLYVTGPDPETGERRTTRLPVWDMLLSEEQVFYYRCYPQGDPHYIDYNEIRLQPVNREAYDQLAACILPVGYQMINLFLVDWQEETWENVSLTDTLEYLYFMENGNDFPWEQWEGSTSRMWIPAQVFEQTLLPRFALTRQRLRELCGYVPESGCYPWRPVHGDQLVTWAYPMCEPELISWEDNPDGTRTLEVEVRSPEKRGELMFSHTLTIRPTETGFQYVGNRVTYVSEYGLPVTLPRFELDGP